MLFEAVHKNRFLTPSQSMKGKTLSAWELNQVRICACQGCPRLVNWRSQILQAFRQIGPDEYYWDKPVPGFGDPFARLMVVGLSPSAYGSGRTGRLFTGDASGNFLFQALHKSGFANNPNSSGFGDSLVLKDVYLSSVARCVAPKNRPRLSELDSCEGFLKTEIELLDRLEGIIALGQVAFERLLTVFRSVDPAIPHEKFAHGAFLDLGPDLPWLLCSYHPSKQNTQTHRLNTSMFEAIWQNALDRLEK